MCVDTSESNLSSTYTYLTFEHNIKKKILKLKLKICYKFWLNLFTLKNKVKLAALTVKTTKKNNYYNAFQNYVY